MSSLTLRLASVLSSFAIVLLAACDPWIAGPDPSEASDPADPSEIAGPDPSEASDPADPNGAALFPCRETHFAGDGDVSRTTRFSFEGDLRVGLSGEGLYGVDLRIEERFDDSWRRVRSAYDFDLDGVTDSCTKTTWTSDSKVQTEAEEYFGDCDDSPNSTTTYTYDADGFLVGTERTGGVSPTVTYTFVNDDHGTLIRSSQDWTGDGVVDSEYNYINSYDDRGRWSEMHPLDDDGVVQPGQQYTYDDDDQLVLITSHLWDAVGLSKFAYDDAGRKIEEIFADIDTGEINGRTTYEYVCAE